MKLVDGEVPTRVLVQARWVERHRGIRHGKTQHPGHFAQRCSAQDAIEFTRPRWENEAQVAGNTIEVHLDSHPAAWVAGRVNELKEVLTNLSLNAVDALPRGGAIRLAADRVEMRKAAQAAALRRPSSGLHGRGGRARVSGGAQRAGLPER